MQVGVGQINDKVQAKAILAWDSKGFDVSGCKDAGEMAAVAELDWEPEIHPVRSPLGGATPWRMVVRPDLDLPLSIVPTKNWALLPNKVFCDRALMVAKRFNGKLNRAGWMRKNSQAVDQVSFAWASIVPGDGVCDELAMNGYEHIKPIILLTSGTAYSIGYRVQLLWVRSICSNGLIDRQANAQRQTHQSSDIFCGFTPEKVKDALRVFLADRELLQNTAIREEAAYLWFAANFGIEDAEFARQPQQMRELWAIYQGECDSLLYESGVDLGQRFIKGNYYGLLQSVVAHANHFGSQSLENRVVALLQEERGRQMEKVRKSLKEAAIARSKGRVSIGVRAW